MGYGEFGGGGSVKWRVNHTNGDHASADGKQKAKGRDKDPTTSGTMMAVWINGEKREFPCDGSTVVVAWGVDAAASAAPGYEDPDESV